MANNKYLDVVGSGKSELAKIDKNYFWKVFKKNAVEILGGEFVFNNDNQDILKTLFRYFCGDEDFNELGIIKNNADLNKGLFIYGTYGVGKTALFKILKETGRELYKSYYMRGLTFRDISCVSFVKLYMVSSKSNTLSFNVQDYYKGLLYIDDLGVENLCFNSYELMGDVIFERCLQGSRTWITTNLTPSQYVQRYGDRLGDRMNEMFNILEWRGTSFRDNL